MKKAQAWLPDFILAFILFTLALTLSMKFIVNIFPDTDYDRLLNDAERISEVFMSEGVPVDWTNETVIKPGLLTKGRFDYRKGENLSVMDYYDVRTLFNTRYDFYVFLVKNYGPLHVFVMNMTPYNYGHADVDPISGKPRADISGINYDHLVRIERFVVMDDSISMMVIYVWD